MDGKGFQERPIAVRRGSIIRHFRKEMLSLIGIHRASMRMMRLPVLEDDRGMHWAIPRLFDPSWLELRTKFKQGNKE
jgi:hypothetical protein